MSRLARDANSQPIQCLRPSATDAFAVTSTASTSSAITNRVVRIMCNVDCFYTVDGTTATTTTATPLPAGTVEFIHTYEGDTISAISNGVDGTFYVTEMI